MRNGSPTIGLASTLLAVTIPDWALSNLGKFVFAIVTAALSSVVSSLIANRMRKP